MLREIKVLTEEAVASEDSFTSNYVNQHYTKPHAMTDVFVSKIPYLNNAFVANKIGFSILLRAYEQLDVDYRSNYAVVDSPTHWRDIDYRIGVIGGNKQLVYTSAKNVYRISFGIGKRRNFQNRDQDLTKNEPRKIWGTYEQNTDESEQ